MNKKLVLVACAALFTVALLGSAQAHMQYGSDETPVCFSMPAPRQLNHVHSPGNATDDCTPVPIVGDMGWPGS